MHTVLQQKKSNFKSVESVRFHPGARTSHQCMILLQTVRSCLQTGML